MYLCYNGFNFAPFQDVIIEFWKCSDSVFSFIFITYIIIQELYLMNIMIMESTFQINTPILT